MAGKCKQMIRNIINCFCNAISHALNFIYANALLFIQHLSLSFA